MDSSELLKKAEMNPHMFMHAGTTQEYMRMFEQVYNHKKRSTLLLLRLACSDCID